MIPLLDVGFPGNPSLERDAYVLSLIENEELKSFTFDGLKRRLSIHPETLSRILHRLEEDGIIEKETSGYRVTPKIANLKLRENASPIKNSVPVLQTYLPSNMQPQKLIEHLQGKWFGLLRWFGLTQDDKGITMKWITEDGGIQINASMEDALLTIEAKFVRDNDLNRALSAAYQLMAYLGKVIPNRYLASHVGYFGDTKALLLSA